MLFLLALVGCGEETAKETPALVPAKTPVTVALNWYPEPEFGGIYEAKLAGLYEAAGLDVDIQAGSASSPVMAQVAAGHVAFGVSTGDEVILARAQQADVVTVFATFQTHPSCIMVHASRGLKGIGDLEGGTLAVEDGIPFAAWLWKKYPLEGVTRVPYQGGVTQWLLDPMYAQQGYVTSEPILAKKEGGDPVCFMVADTGYNPYADVLITNGDELANHREVVAAFVAATRKGWEQYLADGTRANAKIAELNPTLDATVLAAMAAAQKPLIQGGAAEKAGLGTMDADRWSQLEQQLQEVGLLQGPPPPVSSLYTNEFLTGT
jgi:NitT/TauT family transport system substrate-binding protein